MSNLGTSQYTGNKIVKRIVLSSGSSSGGNQTSSRSSSSSSNNNVTSTRVNYVTINGQQFADTITRTYSDGRTETIKQDTSKQQAGISKAQQSHISSIAKSRGITETQARQQIEQAEQKTKEIQKQKQAQQQETIQKEQKVQALQQAQAQQNNIPSYTPTRTPITESNVPKGSFDFYESFKEKQAQAKEQRDLLLRAERTGEQEQVKRETLPSGEIKETITTTRTYETKPKKITAKDLLDFQSKKLIDTAKDIKIFQEKGTTLTDIKLGGYSVLVPRATEQSKSLLRDVAEGKIRVTKRNVGLIGLARADIEREVLQTRQTSLEGKTELEKLYDKSYIALTDYHARQSIKETAIFGGFVIGGVLVGSSAVATKVLATTTGKVLSKGLLASYGITLANQFTGVLTGKQLTSPVSVTFTNFKPSVSLSIPKVQDLDLAQRTRSLLTGVKGVVALGLIRQGVKARIENKQIDLTTYDTIKKPTSRMLIDTKGKTEQFKLIEYGKAQTIGGKEVFIKSKLSFDSSGKGQITSEIYKDSAMTNLLSSSTQPSKVTIIDTPRTTSTGDLFKPTEIKVTAIIDVAGKSTSIQNIKIKPIETLSRSQRLDFVSTKTLTTQQTPSVITKIGTSDTYLARTTSTITGTSVKEITLLQQQAFKGKIGIQQTPTKYYDVSSILGVDVPPISITPTNIQPLLKSGISSSNVVLLDVSTPAISSIPVSKGLLIPLITPSTNFIDDTSTSALTQNNILSNFVPRTFTTSITKTNIISQTQPIEQVTTMPLTTTTTSTSTQTTPTQPPPPFTPPPSITTQFILTTITKPEFKFKDDDKDDKELFGLGFDVFVKKRGRFVKATGLTSLTKSQALDLGASIVSTTPSATFKIMPSSKRIGKLRNNIKGTFTRKRSTFYTKGNLFIEKREKRISSIGELAGITYKGIRAKRKKNIWGNR